MQIKNVLATKGTKVFTIRPEQSLKDAVAMLAKHNVGALVVVDAAGKLAGILSERDVIHVADRNANFFNLPVGDVMSKNPITGSPDDDLLSAERTMTERHFRHLPILEQGKLVGIVSIVDIVKAKVDEYEGEIETLQTQLTRG